MKFDNTIMAYMLLERLAEEGKIDKATIKAIKKEKEEYIKNLDKKE